MKSIDWNRFDCGSAQIEVKGCALGQEERLRVIEDAITAIQRDGSTALSTRYLGVKNYASFGDQRCDCDYGYGPSHGSIVFSVGRRDRDKSVVLDTDAVYLLEVIRDTAPVHDELVERSGLNLWQNNIQNLREAQIRTIALLEDQEAHMEAQQVDASDE